MRCAALVGLGAFILYGIACTSRIADFPPLGDAGTDAPAQMSRDAAPGGSDGAGDGLTRDAAPGDASAGPADAAIADGAPDAGPTMSAARSLALKLGRKGNFLIGMGNDGADNHDNDGAYTLGVTLDLHYVYLVGLPGQGGWPDWNTGGTYVDIIAESSDKHGVVPMFTLYAMASWGDGNLAGLNDDAFMTAYWQGVRLLFTRLAHFNKAAVVHVEPDFWGYAQQRSSGNASNLAVKVASLVPECNDLPNDLSGFGRCVIRLGRMISPKVAIGFHASAWAAGNAPAIATFLAAVGGRDTDLLVLDPLDRDAGCFEAHVDPNCQRNEGGWYWDETNRTSPNFAEHLAWAKQLATGLGKPLLWWQVPFGVPSATPGGTAGHYRDNRVHYLFGHVSEFVAAGFVGAAFGTGAGNQTYITTDGGQFRTAVNAYMGSPFALP